MTDRKRDDANASDLLPALYGELRRLAAAQMSRGAPGSTLQPTALVHEAWMRLGGDQRRFENKSHFFSAAAEAMRHILIDRARQRRALKHGGDQQRVDIQEIEIPVNQDDDDQVIAVGEAVDKLAREHPEIAELVKLRCFVGMEVNEAAQALGIPRTTAYRRWMFARTWLYKELHS
jgi:RNA polymerase sigma factor (TIGR02999 family)